ncbi:FAD-binding oxidoreductase [Microvirga sp. STR05]|uniref:FAD-binding oxidoreductase n=1 Tax=Hymenobacter duratus TaxID=2771356 RepID=A0ABR8JMS3_9BACT|nr:FAD-binding oxidoreductase [Hymenobacter duratus]MBD2716054.1 FAD-binding oxidoreductase [Hymenobacter duratus]MBR7950968.1 FAD-binding oxidoreductase [Microvirga sp. STR05]
MQEYDYLILGHGIAGATLAWELRRRGRNVLVLDAPNPDSASNVAAGLMNPVAGKRFALAWRADELLTAASQLYGEMEAHFGEQFFVQLPIWKLFSSVAEQNTMLARSADKPWQDFVENAGAELPTPSGILNEFGGLCIRRGGYVRLRELLAALAAESLENGLLQHETFDWQQLVTGPTGVTYAGRVRARQLVCCEGAAATQNPFFHWLPLTPNQGEVLDVECPGLSQAQVLNKGAYVVPLSEGQFRVGATYRWPPFAAGTTPEACTELSQRLAATTSLPFTVRAQRAGVRPAVRDRKPLLGRHPEVPVVSIFNGFGSKGVMLAPRLAALLADHLEHPEAALWPEVNIKRYQALYQAAPSAVGFPS